MSDPVEDPATAAAPIPLVLDLDGTLVASDLLVEAAAAHVAARPARIGGLIAAARRGKAALKATIAAATPIDPTRLPWDVRVLAMIEAARDAGRPVWLASGSNERHVAAVAAHLGLDGWLASDDTVNLTGEAKARRLVETFGEKGFDYVGDGAVDLPVWAVCRRGIAVEPSRATRARLALSRPDVTIVPPLPGRAKAWIALFRPHQWVKNALVFLPLITAQKFGAAALVEAVVAFLAFSFAASAVYVFNDLVDLAADRGHPTKKRRPLAAGRVPILAALPAAALLVVAALVAAAMVSPFFAGVIAVYLAVTTAYSFWLKRKMLVDVLVLAGLYTFRVVGGAVAIGVPVSEWLLGFSMFVFTALALIKRYVELAARIDGDLPDPENRDWRKADLPVVSALAAAAAFNAVTVFALWVSSETVHRLYRHPTLLWLVCPILMYWLGRALMLAHRREMADDPILFALKDRNSLLAFALIGAIVVAAVV